MDGQVDDMDVERQAYHLENQSSLSCEADVIVSRLLWLQRLLPSSWRNLSEETGILDGVVVDRGNGC